ncbi:potassium transporter TrkG (plasmid) [Lachnospiraceae bacterium C1.1]
MRIRDKLSSFQIIILGFAGLILLGALLLMLPVSTQSGVVTNFDKTLFTATSAVCVTGLVVFDTATYWSYFGQAVILFMIQIGGLGVVTVASFLTMLAGRKISLMQRQTMQNALSAPQVGGMVKLTRLIFIVTFVVEGIGGTAWDSNLASLRVFMATLRKKLENDSNAYIQTHVGIGYRMLKADTKEN